MAETRLNPWLRPWDVGYESPTFIALRQATEAVGPSRSVDAGAIARRMESRLAGIRRRSPSAGVAARKPASRNAAKNYPSFVDSLRAMSPEEVAAMPPRQREMLRRWLDNAVRGEVRTTEANWRLT